MIVINKERCVECELCVKSCTPKVINPKDGTVDSDRCMLCSHCIAICPKDAVSQNREYGEYILDHNISAESFENLIHYRKSIRNFTPEDVKGDVLERFLNLMSYAPTGTNSQESYITVIQGRDKVTDFSFKMIAFFQRIVKLILNPVTYPILRLLLGKNKANKFYSYRTYLTDIKEGEDILSYNAPLIVIFHSSNKASTPEMDSNIQASYASLHAVTLGLGTCFNGFIAKGLNFNKKLKREYNIPKNHKVYNSLLVGYPELKYKKKVVRQNNPINVIT